MKTGKTLPRPPRWRQAFAVGETLPVKGLDFKVTALTKRGLSLRRIQTERTEKTENTKS